MPRIVLRVRPQEVMDDLDLDAVGERLNRLSWDAELQDARLSDAPYVVVVVDLPETSDEALSRLQEAFGDLPRMRVGLFRSTDEETPLERADLAALREGAESLARIRRE
jgi:hypothetical protein